MIEANKHFLEFIFTLSPFPLNYSEESFPYF
jgi:hypothetical protein